MTISTNKGPAGRAADRLSLLRNHSLFRDLPPPVIDRDLELARGLTGVRFAFQLLFVVCDVLVLEESLHCRPPRVWKLLRYLALLTNSALSSANNVNNSFRLASLVSSLASFRYRSTFCALKNLSTPTLLSRSLSRRI
jgi:hypothetical protein